MSVVFVTRHGKRQQQNHWSLQQGSPKLLVKWHLTEISWASNNIMRCHESVHTCRLVLQCLVRIWSATPCYRTFPVLGWACNFPSAQQACRTFFRVIYVGGPLKGPQLTTTADTLTPTRYCVFSLILFVNWNVFYKT
jgi:hypothetical protein